ncbi:MAG: 50S ribosomal protein L11 methyltransferase [Gammaproteobacteria bacterium]|jgi:ribosomal protein L11 methyltransferase
MPWLQLSLQIDSTSAREAADEMEAAGAASVTLEDAEDSPLLEPAPGETPLWPTVVVTGLFDSEILQDLTRLQESAVWKSRQGFHLSRVPDRAWEREWLKHFRPRRFGRHLWVCPAGLTPEDDGAGVILTLDPGLAFGTGTHETTALCLQWLDAHPPENLRVLDFGCGSGILAIAAALLGARIVYARDIDPQALEATRNNALRNEVADRVLTAPADGEIPGCDLLISNILAGTLMDLAPNFARALPGGAQVVLSGILAEQAAAVIEAYSPWFGLQQLAEQDGWILLAGHRQETD